MQRFEPLAPRAKSCFLVSYLLSAGFGGPVTKEYIIGQDGEQIGLRYNITKVAEKDAGAYNCTVENKFGTDTKYLTVNVALDFSIGKKL